MHVVLACSYWHMLYVSWRHHTCCTCEKENFIQINLTHFRSRDVFQRCAGQRRLDREEWVRVELRLCAARSRRQTAPTPQDRKYRDVPEPSRDNSIINQSKWKLVYTWTTLVPAAAAASRRLQRWLLSSRYIEPRTRSSACCSSTQLAWKKTHDFSSFGGDHMEYYGNPMSKHVN